MSSTRHRGVRATDLPPSSGGACDTRQRVLATDNIPRSFGGRASSPIEPLDSAASCTRRVAAVSSDEPSAITAVPGQRSAASIAQRRSVLVEGSMSSVR